MAKNENLTLAINKVGDSQVGLWNKDIDKLSNEVNSKINTLSDKVDAEINVFSDKVDILSDRLIEVENRHFDMIHYMNTYGDLKPHIIRAPDKSCYVLTWVSDVGEIFVKSLGKKKFKMYVSEGDYLAVKRFRKIIVFDAETGKEITV